MEILAFIFIWPFLILAVGLALIALVDIALLSSLWVVVPAIVLIWLMLRSRTSPMDKALTPIQQLELLRANSMIFSIGLLLPIFVRYLMVAAEFSLFSIILTLALGFGAAVWGMFIHNNRVLKYSNLLGGALTIAYAYSQLWSLGDLARIIAAAFGLLAAVAVSIIKLKDKLS
jgi:hypothetical protein